MRNKNIAEDAEKKRNNLTQGRKDAKKDGQKKGKRGQRDRRVFSIGGAACALCLNHGFTRILGLHGLKANPLNPPCQGDLGSL